MGISVVIDVGSGHLRVCGRRRAQGEQTEAASFEASTAVWAGADGEVRCAGAARRAALSAPEQEVIGWVHRMGDPVPFHTAAGPLTGAQLARQVLRRPVAEVVESLMEPSSSGVTDSRQLARVGVLVPDHWPVSRVRTVVDAVRDGVAGEAAAPTVVEAVRRGTAVRSAMTFAPGQGERSGHTSPPAPEEAGQATLVLDVGADTVRADVIDQNLEGVRSVRGVQQEALGGDALDDVVLRHVLAQLPGELRSRATTPEGRPELVRLRAACREARETLSVVTEAVVSARFGEAVRDVRLVRHELETLIEPQLEQILDVGDRALEASGAILGHVVLIGGTARTPRLVQLASARWSMPVDRPETPDNVLALAALDLVEEAEAPAAPVVAVPAEGSGPQTEVTAGQATTLPTSPRPGPETGADDTAQLGGLALLGLVDLPRGVSDELSPAAHYLDASAAIDDGDTELDEGSHLRHGSAAGTPRALGVGVAALLLTGVGVAFAVVPGMSGSGSDKVVTRIQTETVTIDDSVAVPWAPSGLPSIGTEAESTTKEPAKKKSAPATGPAHQQAPAPAPVQPAPEQAPVEQQQPAPAENQQEQAPAPAPSAPAPSTPRPTGPTSSAPATSGTTTPTTTGGGETTGTLDPTGEPTSGDGSGTPTSDDGTDSPTSGNEPTTGTTSPGQDGSPSDQGGEATAPDSGGLGSGPDPAP